MGGGTLLYPTSLSVRMRVKSCWISADISHTTNYYVSWIFFRAAMNALLLSLSESISRENDKKAHTSMTLETKRTYSVSHPQDFVHQLCPSIPRLPFLCIHFHCHTCVFLFSAGRTPACSCCQSHHGVPGWGVLHVR